MMPVIQPATATAPHPQGHCAAPDLKVETVSDYRAFLDLAPAWNRLVDDAGVNHPFLTHEWMSAWWECFGAGRELHILVVKDGTEIVAIVPLMLSVERIYGLSMRLIEFLYNVYSERCDFIVGRHPDQIYQAVLRHLVEHQARWDVMRLCQLPAESRTLEALPRLAAQSGFLTGLWSSSRGPYVPLTGEEEDYFKGLGRKHRANLRNRLKRLGRLGPVDLEIVTCRDGLGDALEEGWRLEAAAWKGQAGSAIRCLPPLRRFYTEIAQRAEGRGWLHLHFLRVNRRRIAFGYTLRFKNKLFLLKLGYDPQYAPYSPCNLMCHLVLRDAFKRDLVEYDFLGESDAWKLEWANQARLHQWLFVCRRRLPVSLIHFAKFRLAPLLRPEGVV